MPYATQNIITISNNVQNEFELTEDKSAGPKSAIRFFEEICAETFGAPARNPLTAKAVTADRA